MATERHGLVAAALIAAFLQRISDFAKKMACN